MLVGGAHSFYKNKRRLMSYSEMKGWFAGDMLLPRLTCLLGSLAILANVDGTGKWNHPYATIDSVVILCRFTCSSPRIE